MREVSIKKVKDLHKKSGGHWFDEGAINFFASIVYETAYEVDDGIYFLSSEQYISGRHKGPRMFSIRKCSLDGSIDTIGKFMQYDTFSEAHDALMEILHGAKEEE